MLLLTENLFWYPWEGYGNNCNTYLLQGEKNILVDPGHLRNEFGEDCLEQLRKKIEKDGFSFEDIKLIVCTHGHPDHYESAPTIREESGARIAVHREEEYLLDAMARIYRERGGNTNINFTPDIFLQEGDLEVGDTVLKVLHTPGHSPGSACFYHYKEKALISGDTVFRSSIGRTDLPGGDMELMKKSIEKLSLMEEEIQCLLPGHMDMVSGPENVNRNFSTIKNYFF